MFYFIVYTHEENTCNILHNYTIGFVWMYSERERNSKSGCASKYWNHCSLRKDSYKCTLRNKLWDIYSREKYLDIRTNIKL